MGCNNCFLSAPGPTALTGFVSGQSCPVSWAETHKPFPQHRAKQSLGRMTSLCCSAGVYRPPKVPLPSESQCPPPHQSAPSPCHRSTSLRTPGPSICKPLPPSRVQSSLQSPSGPRVSVTGVLTPPPPRREAMGPRKRGSLIFQSLCSVLLTGVCPNLGPSSLAAHSHLLPSGSPTHPRVQHLVRALLLESDPGSDSGAILQSKTISNVTIPPGSLPHRRAEGEMLTPALREGGQGGPPGCPCSCLLR